MEWARYLLTFHAIIDLNLTFAVPRQGRIRPGRGYNREHNSMNTSEQSVVGSIVLARPLVHCVLTSVAAFLYCQPSFVFVFVSLHLTLIF